MKCCVEYSKREWKTNKIVTEIDWKTHERVIFSRLRCILLVRKIEKNIANWIKNGEKTLIVQGGRQVGKTYTIRKCLKRSNFKYVEFNFIDDFRLSKL